MDFNTFKNSITALKNRPIGGVKAQFNLAPKLRLSYTKEKIKALKPKKAAVLALFYPDLKGKTKILLTLRASYPGTHSSQISFPGGKYDANDDSLKTTATRETFEEVGIEAKQITVFKKMTTVFIPPSNFLVTPFLGFVNTTPTFKTNYEVEKLIAVSIQDLLNDASITTTTITTSYAKNIEVPCFQLNSYVVWGATAMMLNEIKALLKNN
jgi:8-oxo-dGTP pyrophosphatase MutT (NUDIX family)